MSSAANSQECFSEVIGRKVIAVLFAAFPLQHRDLAAGSKTLVFDDGTGLTVAANGSYWRERSDEVALAITTQRKQLEDTQAQIERILVLAGRIPRTGSDDEALET